MRLDEAVRAVRAPDEAAMAAARERQARLTKPPGSLGALEELSVRLAGLAGRCPPPVPAEGGHRLRARGRPCHRYGLRLEPVVREHLRVPADCVRTIPNGIDSSSQSTR